MLVWIFLMGCDNKEKPKREVVRTPYGYDCVKESPGVITCWDSEGPLPEKKE